MLIVLSLAAASAGIAAAAAGGAGPSPGVLQGGVGIAARDGIARYVALPGGDSTVVAAVRVRDGRVIRSGWAAGRWGIPLVTWSGDADGLSHDGRTLVLAPAGNGFRSVSRFSLLDLRRFRVARSVTLRGMFSFDALSPDARTLYLTELLSPRDVSRYRIRAYDLVRGRLYPQAVVDREEPDERMTGSPVARATAADGRWVYTLYAGGDEPFVHALDTIRRESVCIDLPWQGSQDPLWRMRLALGPGERQILVRGGGRRIALPAPA
jgi:hypothetical protein